MRGSRFLFLTMIMLPLAACSQSPASVIHKSSRYLNQAISKTVSNFSKNERAPASIKVRSGDTVYQIAKRYNISSRDIIETNHLNPPYALRIGQILDLPQARFHVVKRGETLYEISRQYKVDLSRLVKVNNLKPPYQIKVGQNLQLAPEVVVDHPIVSVQEKSLQPIPNIDLTAKKAGPIPVRKTRNAKQYRTLAYTPQAKPVRMRSYSGVPIPNQRPVKQKKSKNLAVHSRPPRFTWPVRGRLLSRFGPKKGGLYNDGINILASEGAAIRAAEDGKIVYVGNELKGYGNLIIIRHNAGMLTAYAHNRDALVKKGQWVKKGEKIGHVGQSGNVNKPQLHFGIRKGRKALDPEKYLRS